MSSAQESEEFIRYDIYLLKEICCGFEPKKDPRVRNLCEGNYCLAQSWINVNFLYTKHNLSNCIFLTKYFNDSEMYLR